MDDLELIKSIHKDQARFREIVRGKVKQDLRKYVSRGELIGKKGDQVISIPVPQIDLPHFRLGGKRSSGVGQGDGDEGDALGPAEGEEGSGKAGDKPGEHVLEVEMSIEELAEILGSALALPRIKPKGRDVIEARKIRYTGIYRVGPQSLRHFRRTFKQALKRTISGGMYNPDNPLIIPVREDFRYRSWKEHPMPRSNAVAIYMMDVSGSMGDEQKELVRMTSFWIDAWLKAHYKGIVVRYITHDAEAREVDEETFFHSRESGGTMISSAYKLCAEIIEKDYPEADWNVYPFHFSDGDNWSSDDSAEALETVRARILPHSNQFAYGQVESHYGSGQFLKEITAAMADEIRDGGPVVTAEIKGKEGVLDAIRAFLKGGR
jgi:uncharacterized sporulation protein YeaH/YhbH (DUF444 family)